MIEASFIGEYSSAFTPVIPLWLSLEVSIRKQKQAYILSTKLILDSYVVKKPMFNLVKYKLIHNSVKTKHSDTDICYTLKGI